MSKGVTVVKCTLNAILKSGPNQQRIATMIADMCRRATKISVMGSLAVLHFINNAYDTNLDIFNDFLSGHIEHQFR